MTVPIIVVCARGGSKGIPWKNFKSPFEGKTPYEVLREKLDNSILSSAKSFVSSDSDEILSLASQSGFIPLKRPNHLALGSSRIVEVLKDIKDSLNFPVSSHIIQISAVSPFLRSSTIDKVAKLSLKGECSVITVTQFHGNSHPALAGSVENGKFSYIYEFTERYPRQKRPPLYYPNGCMFSRPQSSISGCIKTNDLPANPVPVMMEAFESLNLDDINDWNLALSIASSI